jgi:hypothetical protein
VHWCLHKSLVCRLYAQVLLVMLVLNGHVFRHYKGRFCIYIPEGCGSFSGSAYMFSCSFTGLGLMTAHLFRVFASQ